ncbi:MAG: hypothetical protein ACK5WM_22740 [Rhodospirillales bacterium]|jgi:hypothetical protein
MPTALRHVRLRAAVATLYAVAMLLLGVAHAPLAHAPLARAAAKPSVDFAAFVLPDGSLPDLCVVADGGSGDPPPHHVAATLCDACLLTGAPGLPPPPAADLGRLSLDTAPLAVPAERTPVARFEVPGTSRAPPSPVVAPA